MKNTVRNILFWGAAIAVGKLVYHGWCTALGVNPISGPTLITVHKHYECHEDKEEKSEENKEEQKEN